MRVFYLVHDLDDEAVKRRVRFLRQGGAEVDVAGFRRGPVSGPAVASDWIEIGRTHNGRMVQRVVAAGRAVSSCRAWAGDLRRADVMVARNLEMLAVAVGVRARLKSTVPIVYECLDIHRLMIGGGMAGAALRCAEGWLLRSSALLVVSSPRFIETYFRRMHADLPRSVVLENKLLAGEGRAAVDRARGPAPGGPPWRIGWFGIIRCRKSLLLLAALTERCAGRVEVEIRGRPARDAIPDFDAIVAQTPGLHFGGPYDRATDLGGMYRGVHFNWTIDFYDEGENSAWLLPNRLYEGGAFGTVPLALRAVEAGRWLERHGCGVLFGPDVEREQASFFEGLTETIYQGHCGRIGALDTEVFVETPEAASRFVADLGALAGSLQPAVTPFAQGKAA